MTTTPAAAFAPASPASSSSGASSGMYRQLTMLDRDRHATLKLGSANDMTFATGLLLAPLVTPEFSDAAREYPIVFVRDAEQALIPVAVTGLPGGKNIFINANGVWDARYIPAYVRRHPFVFVRTAPEQLTVCIDEGSGRLGVEGVALFEAGQSTPMMQQIIDGLTEYERHAQFTLNFMKRLEASGILQESNAHAELNGKSVNIEGLLTVDEARLRALPEATIKEWFNTGELGLVYAHLISLGNLLELLRRQPDAADAAPTA